MDERSEGMDRITEAAKGIPGYGSEHLDFLKNTRARYQAQGKLDAQPIDLNISHDDAPKTVRDVILDSTADLVRLLQQKGDRGRLIEAAQIIQVSQRAAAEIDKLRRGEDSALFTPSSLSQTKHNTAHARSLRQVIGSAVIALSGPRRGQGTGGAVAKSDPPYLMTRAEAYEEVADVLCGNDLIKDVVWVKDQFNRFSKKQRTQVVEGNRVEPPRRPVIDPPSGLGLKLMRLSRQDQADRSVVLGLVRAELRAECIAYVDEEKRVQK